MGHFEPFCLRFQKDENPQMRSFHEIAGERLDLSGAPSVPIECALDFAPQAGKRRVR